MLFADGGLALIVVALWLFCIIDVITTPDTAVRNLPKLLWLIIVLILPDIGSLAWLIAGRPWNRQPADVPYKGNHSRVTARPAGTRPSNPDDDEEFLAQLRARAEEQRRRAREPQQRDEPPAAEPPPVG